MARLHELVATQAARTPEAVAVRSSRATLTYGELLHRSGRLADRLRSLGVGPETLVGVCLERSPELVLAELAVVAAGGAWLPLDPAHPAERRAHLVEDAAVPVVVTCRALAGTLGSGARLLVLEDEELAGPAAAPSPGVAVQPENLAYVIYTSGSTGSPKGTELTHAGLLNLIAWHRRVYAIAPSDRTTLLASPAFDASVWEIWPALVSGASLHVPPREVVSSPADLLGWLAAEGITVAFLPTPLAQACLALPLPADLELRLLLTGGDRLQRVGRELPFRLVNHYGPTETTVVATAGAVAAGDGGEALPAIGRPIDGFEVVLLDAALQPVTDGGAGEIAIAGAGLARGYLRRPDLTAERFVPDPRGETAGGRLYRSGDLARRLPDGDLDFLGRMDHQVKIRGVRIELGEVEAALERCAAVRQAVAGVAPGPAGDPRLVAWVVPEGPGADLAETLRRRLLAVLPEAMVPSAFVTLDELPLTSAGKVDRRALPVPVPGAEAGEPAAPRTPTETALAGIWGELLGLERIGPGRHFVELGGHSLLAAQVVARVRDRLGVEITLRDVFEAPVLSDLASRIEARPGRAAPTCPLVAVPRHGDLPLSFAQERVWFLQRLDPTIQSYQFQATLRLSGRLAVEAWRRSLEEIVRRHEIFRTTFPTVGDRPVQRFHEAWEVPLPVVDFAGLPEAVREAAAAAALDAFCREPFDMARLPLVRWTLLRRGPEEHVWVHAEHHLVHDGWSFNRLLGELVVLYGSVLRDEPAALPELGLQFADWAVWQRGWMETPEAAAQIEWWKRTLAGRPAVLALPTDRPRPRRQSFAGRLERVELPAALCAALQAASRRRGISLYALMQTAFAALLSRYADQEEVNVGSAVANRGRQETEAILGMIVDNVVLADDLRGNPTVGELLERTWRLALETAARQDVPFDLVVEAVQPPRDLAFNPLFQASFSFHDAPLAELALPGLRAELTEGLSNGSAKFDVNVIGIPRRERITLVWESAAALFDASTARRMIGHFETLLAGFAAAPEARVAELPLLNAAEREQIVDWSGRDAVVAGGLAHEWAEVWARRTPAALAVAGGGRSLTYAELDALSNRVARRLRRLGVGPEVRVGLSLPRSPELVAAALGVLKAGGAYVPLDPEHPAERRAWILKDAAVPVLIAAAFFEELADESDEPLAVTVAPQNLAYVIYTSGSTGRPKGTELSHAGLVNLIAWHLDAYGLGPADRATLVASPAFDASVWETWPVLAAGASLHVAPEAVRASPTELLAWLAAERITVSFLPTPLAQACLELEVPQSLVLRVLLTGGDRLLAVERPLPFRLVNHYGPTECTVVATAGTVDGDLTPAIGRPIANLRAWVLDRALQPVPVGVQGELHIGGVGLARGYLGRPELTAEKLLPDPFGEPGSRLYATGDLVRFRADGRLDFLARLDQQVKIRGFRVELGEIEAVLARHPAVAAAAVAVRARADGPRLVGYAVAREDVSADDLRAFVAVQLPAPMVPGVVMLLAELPLSPHGKVDRAALPEPGPPADGGGEASEPRTPVEHLLREIWSELTGLERVGIRDDFFELGGHSLLGARMLSRLRDELDVDLPLSTVFERPTIEALAAAVEDQFLAESR